MMDSSKGLDMAFGGSKILLLITTALFTALIAIFGLLWASQSSQVTDLGNKVGAYSQEMRDTAEQLRRENLEEVRLLRDKIAAVHQEVVKIREDVAEIKGALKEREKGR